MQDVWIFVVAVMRGFRRHRDTQAASAIAYQVLFAMVPLIGTMLAGVGLVLRDPAEQRMAVEWVLEVLPFQSNGFVTESIRGLASQSAALTVLGVAGVLWSASNLFGAIRDALNTTWEVRRARGFVRDKLMDIGTMFGLGLLLAASVIGTAMVHLLQAVSVAAPAAIALRALVPILRVVALILPALFSFSAFMILYRFVPNVKHCARDVVFGAALATLMFEAVKNLFTIYVKTFTEHHTAYGALGDVMLFMLWMWVSANILLIGAEVAAEYCREESGPPKEAKAADPDEPTPVTAAQDAVAPAG